MPRPTGQVTSRAQRRNAIVVSAVGVLLGSLKALLLFAVTGAWVWLLVLPVLVGWAWHRLGQGAYPAGPPTPLDVAGGAETGASS